METAAADRTKLASTERSIDEDHLSPYTMPVWTHGLQLERMERRRCVRPSPSKRMWDRPFKHGVNAADISKNEKAVSFCETAFFAETNDYFIAALQKRPAQSTTLSAKTPVTLSPMPSRHAIWTAKLPIVELSTAPRCTSRPVASAVRRLRNSF